MNRRLRCGFAAAVLVVVTATGVAEADEPINAGPMAPTHTLFLRVVKHFEFDTLDAYAEHTKDPPEIRERAQDLIRNAKLAALGLPCEWTREKFQETCRQLRKDGSGDPLVIAVALQTLPNLEDYEHVLADVRQAMADVVETYGPREQAEVIQACQQIELALSQTLWRMRGQKRTTFDFERSNPEILQDAYVRWLEAEADSLDRQRYVWFIMTRYYLNPVAYYGNWFNAIAEKTREKEVHPWMRHMLDGYAALHAVKEFQRTGGDFVAKYTEAAAAYRAAWELAPEFPESALELLDLARQGRVEEDPRVWFDRAIRMELDYSRAYTVYRTHLRSLGPDALLAFGNECMATERYDTRVPFEILECLCAIERSTGENVYERPGIYEKVRELCQNAINAPICMGAPPTDQTRAFFHGTQLVVAARANRLEEVAALWDKTTMANVRHLSNIYLLKTPLPSLKAATMAAAAVEDPEVVQRVEASLAAVKDEASLKTAAESIAAAAANFAPDNARVAQWRAAHAFYQDFYASRWATLSFSPELPELAAVDHWTREDEHTLSTRGYEELPLETLVQLPAPFELSVQITTLETPEGDSLAGVHLGKVQLAPSTETKGSFFGVNTLTHEYGSRHAYLAKRKLESEQATYELRIRAWPGYHEAFVDGQRVEMRSEVTFEPTTHASLWVGGPPNTTAHVRFANLKLRRLNFEPPPSRRSAPEDRIAYYDARLEQEPDNLYHQLDRADALLASGKTDEALADYERLLTKRKDWPHVMAQKGRILVAKGEATEAIALFKKVLESAPVIEAGDTAKTLKIRSDGTVRQPITTGALSHAIAYERLAWLEATSNDAKFRNGKNAVEHAKLAIALSNAEHPEYFLTLAVAYAEARNNAEAKKVLLKAGDLEGLPEQALLEPIQEVLLQKKQFRYPAP